MGSFAVALNVVLPLVALMAIGYLSRELGWVSGGAFEQMNLLVFRVLLPCLLFYNIYASPFDEVIDAGLIAYGVAAVAVLFAACAFVARALTSDPTKRGVALQAMFRSNFIIFNLPVVQSLYGDRTGATTVLISVIAPVFNVLAVFALETSRSEKARAAAIARSAATNPLIIATAAGLACSAAGIRFPAMADQALGTVVGAATPVALIILGGTFQRRSLKENRRLLVPVTAVRLLAAPAVFLSGAVALGFRDVELLSLLMLFGSPVAVSSFSMAQQMGGDSEFAGQIVLLTTAASVFTIFMWVSALNYFGLVK